MTNITLMVMVEEIVMGYFGDAKEWSNVINILVISLIAIGFILGLGLGALLWI